MERVMSELLLYFDEKKEIEIHLIIYGSSREMFYSIPDSVNVHYPNFNINKKFKFISALRTLLFIRKLIKKLNPSSVLSFGEEWNNLVLLSLVGLNKKIIISDRARPGKKIRSSYQEFLRDKLYPYADGIIVQTQEALEIYREKFPNSRIKAIGNPFRVPESLPETIKENIILSVGRLIKSKHFDILIEIFSSLDRNDWKLVIIGGNAGRTDEMKKLKGEIERQKINNNVILTGTVSDVDTWYRISKIFAFTSSSEGFPNVIGEAMLNGLPVIAFDCTAGPSEMVKDGKNGYLIPLFDKMEFERKLKNLMDNGELREEMGKKSREVIRQFSVDVIAEKYYSFIVSEK